MSRLLDYVRRVSGLSLFLLSTAQAAALYTVSDLGTITPTGLNNAGEVSGADPVTHTPLMISMPQHVVTPLGLLSGCTSGGATGISDGYVVGSCWGGALAVAHGFRWTTAGGLQDLGRPTDPNAGCCGRLPAAVNAGGIVVGFIEDARPGNIPFVWDGTGYALLPTLGPGGGQGYPHAINDVGDIVGESEVSGRGSPYHATLWRHDGQVIDLTPGSTDVSTARGINNASEIVGGANGAFRWTPTQGRQDLGMLAGDSSSGAMSINTAGVIVGTSVTGGRFPTALRAVQWNTAGIVDLNTLIDAPGWVLEDAIAINDTGWIVGNGTLNGQPRAWLLVPVPGAPPVPLVLVVTGDFNRDGVEDQAGLAVDGSIWLGLAGALWRQIPGRLAQVVAGDFDGDGKDDLAGLGADGSIWISTTLQTWRQIWGRLQTLVTGKLTGTSRGILAGLAANGTVWASYDTHTWRWIPGRFVTLAVVNDHLVGMSWDGRQWWSPVLGEWVLVSSN